MKSLLKLRYCLCIPAILGGLAAAPADAQNAAEIPAGVVGAALRDEHNHPKNAPDDTLITMGDRVVVAIKNLDGWLYEGMRVHAFPEQHWFDAESARVVAATEFDALFDRSKDSVGTTPADAAARERARLSLLLMVREIRQKLYLQIGPARLRNIHPEDPFVRQDSDGVWHLVFVVSNADKDKDEWAKLRNVHGQERSVSLSVAFDLRATTGELSNSYSLPSVVNAPADSVLTPGAPLADQGFRFRVYSPGYAVSFCAAYLVALVLFGWLAAWPNLLRDPDGPVRDGMHVFSLSRCVLAWWFFLVLGAWLLLWILTGTLNTLNQTALLLTGIGSATALGGTLAGKIRDTVAGDDVRKPADTTLNAGDRPRAFRRRLGAFIYDLLCDEDTIGFHRFQTLIWNGVLGLVFVVGVWTDFAMPTFDATLLGLLGISSATFIGFKMTPTTPAGGSPAPTGTATPAVAPGGSETIDRPAARPTRVSSVV